MTDYIGSHGGCVLCAVRDLTEGAPAKKWVPGQVGDHTSGVVVRTGRIESDYGYDYLFVDLWTGVERVRVVAWGWMFQEALTEAEIKIGDRASFRFDQMAEITHGPNAGRQYKKIDIKVTRGHH